jgi:hypothetical protein
MNGQCYAHALQLIQTLYRDGVSEQDPEEKALFQDLVLIHGSVVPDCGPDVDRRIDHAWVEMSGFVYDPAQSVTKPSVAPAAYYRERYQGVERVRYHPNEAMACFRKFNDYGPWDDRT